MKTTPFDIQNYLKTPADVEGYLVEALETGDAGFISVAVADSAQALGVPVRIEGRSPEVLVTRTVAEAATGQLREVQAWTLLREFAS